MQPHAARLRKYEKYVLRPCTTLTCVGIAAFCALLIEPRDHSRQWVLFEFGMGILLIVGIIAFAIGFLSPARPLDDAELAELAKYALENPEVKRYLAAHLAERKFINRHGYNGANAIYWRDWNADLAAADAAKKAAQFDTAESTLTGLILGLDSQAEQAAIHSSLSKSP